MYYLFMTKKIDLDLYKKKILTVLQNQFSKVRHQFSVK